MMIKDQGFVPLASQRLFNDKGKKLEDDRTLSDYNIQEESVIYVHIGGCFGHGGK